MSDVTVVVDGEGTRVTVDIDELFPDYLIEVEGLSEKFNPDYAYTIPTRTVQRYLAARREFAEAQVQLIRDLKEAGYIDD